MSSGSATVVVSQEPIALELRWRGGDPVTLTLTVLAVNWSGAHTARAGTVDMGVTATYVGADTVFVFTMSQAASETIRTAGSHKFWCKSATGRTRFLGNVVVSG